MPNIITITQLETVINRVREVAPPVNYILSPDLRALAEVYGRMIGEHAESIDLDHEPAALRHVVLKWLPPTGGTATACAYRTGESGPDCEACQ
ncbi:DUF3717 domain-containing protein [Massilia soli]|uniref:DUF3717 domain-containing protein n=1 Tax=Massilia soli TaxID=2792854 RepID=A0ABS7SLZ2_9BURK|nr:DUF3717 domain-containing protein [Massilia soli]MBZ2207186.1 DUF3717 domain-containing protein [Massilia soli]